MSYKSVNGKLVKTQKQPKFSVKSYSTTQELVADMNSRSRDAWSDFTSHELDAVDISNLRSFDSHSYDLDQVPSIDRMWNYRLTVALDPKNRRFEKLRDAFLSQHWADAFDADDIDTVQLVQFYTKKTSKSVIYNFPATTRNEVYARNYCGNSYRFDRNSFNWLIATMVASQYSPVAYSAIKMLVVCSRADLFEYELDEPTREMVFANLPYPDLNDYRTTSYIAVLD